MSAIDPSFAQQIVKLIQQETNQNAHFFGEGGKIIATTQPERLGNIHEGARDIMSGKIESIAITEEMAMTLKGARPGFSVGIDSQGQRIGAIGITGNPNEMRPIAMIASHMTVLEYERKIFMDHLNKMASEINKSLQESSAGLEELSASSDQQFSTFSELTEMVDVTKDKIMETNQIIDFINSISKQTTILGINASIEAARIGSEGKGFNVVASEIRKLADNTSRSVKQIDEVLNNIQQLISTLSQSIASYADTTQEQTTVIQSLAKELENITASVDDFIQKLA
ncbi:sugar diacid recognition domain-containing protein [Alkaliphilus crotonatoxidans]